MVVREAKSEKGQTEAFDALDSINLIGAVLNSSSNNEHKSYYMYYGTSHNNGTPE